MGMAFHWDFNCGNLFSCDLSSKGKNVQMLLQGQSFLRSRMSTFLV
uniref:Uncharacterized protein n=1 Tax=Picea sitchensis TaxID=3332 RepID=A9NLM1_PICSI|nr:unknown [Picea sitchensis]